MRKGVLITVLVLFAGWFVWKALPFLTAQRAVIAATPTTQPSDPSAIAPVKVKGGERACLDRIPFGPDASYVQVTPTAGRFPAGAIAVEARAPGYVARTRIPAGAPGDAPVNAKIAPAPHDVGDGVLCLTNEGRHTVAFYGVNPGRGESPSTTTVDGRPVPQDLSLTLLSPGNSIGGRLGDISSHLAAFRPLAGWEVFLLGLLAVLGVPIAVGVALARAAAEDDRLRDEDGGGAVQAPSARP